MNSTKFHTLFRCAFVLIVFLMPRASGGYSSIYAFGDGVCTTTADLSPAALYYGDPGAKRYCNGKIWIEVLSRWQGVTYDASKNLSYFEHFSGALKTNATNFVAPADAETALFIVWCNDADFVKFVNEINSPYSNLSPWNSRINQSIIDHTAAITTLYNKGARVILMPNAVNIMATPNYNLFDQADRNFVRARVLDFNNQFEVAMANLEASKTGLKIYRPNVFDFFEQVLANPSAYGMVNPTPTIQNPDINAATLADLGASAVDGSPGSNYVFWDPWHPTAKFQMELAAFTQQMISPIQVTNITRPGSNTQITIANVPLGRAGVVAGSAALVPPWQTEAAINVPFSVGGSTTTSVTFPAVGTKRFYRVGFPVVWTWP